MTEGQRRSTAEESHMNRRLAVLLAMAMFHQRLVDDSDEARRRGIGRLEGATRHRNAHRLK